MKECNTLIYLFTKEKAATSIVRRGFKTPHFGIPPISENSRTLPSPLPPTVITIPQSLSK